MILVFCLLVVAHLAAAIYAQRRLPDYVAAARRAQALRAVLLITGLAVGSVALVYSAQPLVAMLAFLSGFGAVHVPAALIRVHRARRPVREFLSEGRLAPPFRGPAQGQLLALRSASYAFFARLERTPIGWPPPM